MVTVGEVKIGVERRYPLDQAAHSRVRRDARQLEPAELEPWLEKGRTAGVPTRGISDHELVRSIYASGKAGDRDLALNAIVRGAPRRAAHRDGRLVARAALTFMSDGSQHRRQK